MSLYENSINGVNRFTHQHNIGFESDIYRSETGFSRSSSPVLTDDGSLIIRGLQVRIPDFEEAKCNGYTWVRSRTTNRLHRRPCNRDSVNPNGTCVRHYLDISSDDSTSTANSIEDLSRGLGRSLKWIWSKLTGR